MESKSQETDAFVVSQEFLVEHIIPVHGPSPRPIFRRQPGSPNSASISVPSDITKSIESISGYRCRTRRFVDSSCTRGADIQAFRGKNLLVPRRVTPYDAFALWMHRNRQRSLLARNGRAPEFCIREQTQSYFKSRPSVLSGRSTKRCP